MKVAMFKVIQMVSAVSAWAAKALEDGKVTKAEAEELINTLCGILGVPFEVDLTPGEE